MMAGEIEHRRTLEELAGYGRTRDTSAGGSGNPLEAGVIGLLALVGRLAGYRERYERYSERG